MTRMVYLVGGAGVGKSTVMAALLQGWQVGPNVSLANGFNGHWLDHPVLGRGLYLGDMSPHRQFPGTDCLARHSPPYVKAWFLEHLPADLAWVFAEGQRLATRTLLPTLHATTHLTLVRLVLNAEEAARRRTERSLAHAADTGEAPLVWDDNWVRGNFTRAANVTMWAQDQGLRVVEVDANQAPAQVVAAVRRVI